MKLFQQMSSSEEEWTQFRDVSDGAGDEHVEPEEDKWGQLVCTDGEQQQQQHASLGQLCVSNAMKNTLSEGTASDIAKLFLFAELVWHVTFDQ